MSRVILVEDIFSKSFATVKANDPLSKCWKLFKNEVAPVVAVEDENRNYVGIITRRWVVRSRLDHATTKIKTLMRSAPIIAPDFTISRVSKLMIESGVRQLPVFDNKKLLGFITDQKIIEKTIIQDWGNSKVETIMTKTPYTINSNRSVGAVLNLIREHGISHIPVITKGKLSGIISIQDIIEYIYQPKLRQTKGEFVGEKGSVLNLPVKGVMSKSVITIFPEDSIRKAYERMQKHKISSLVVVQNEEIVGIITKLDFLEPISQFERKKKDFEVQFGIKNVAISPYQKRFLIDEFNSFINKYKEVLISGTIFVYMKTHGETHKRAPFIHCRLQLKTPKGAFFSSGEGYGIEPTFRLALNRLDRRLLRSKELGHYPKYARGYLQTIGFPQEEL